MLSATQPFISGAISKTVNVPENISVDEIRDIYLEAWKAGLKAISIYRDNSKRTQPLSTVIDKAVKEHGRPYRRRLPDERQAITHKFSIGGHEGYITAGMYEDGSPGEIFIVMAKEGSAVSGLMDAFATAISMALQYGVPLKVLCNKFTHSRFEPSGFTNNRQIPFAKSIMDYIFRWLALKFLSRDDQLRYMSEDMLENNDQIAQDIKDDTEEVISTTPVQSSRTDTPIDNSVNQTKAQTTEKLNKNLGDDKEGLSCFDCGGLMVRNGSCYSCRECGSSSGCS
jgi:ribonucleoside-diphosphate reductase alpha chain